MAQTEFHIIKQDRHFDELYLAVNGALQGAFRIWRELERKYLPSLPPLPWSKPGEYVSRLSRLFDDDALKEVWKIPCLKQTEWNDRILMMIYMDKAYIAYDDLHEVAEALRGCTFATDNMKGQADVLDKIHDEHQDGSVFGVMINATSVNCAEDFMDCDYDEEGEITDRRLHKEAFDAIQFLRDLQRFDWNEEKYDEWHDSQNKEKEE